MNTEQITKLPKYFVIKRDANNPLWDKYISWLNSIYHNTHDGSAKFYGISPDNKTSDYWYSNNMVEDKTIYVHKECVLITLEQWDAIVNKKEEFEMYESMYGKRVKVNDRFETECLWCEEMATLNRGRYIPLLVEDSLIEEHERESKEPEQDWESLPNVEDRIKAIKELLSNKWGIKSDSDLIYQLGIKEYKEEKEKLFLWINYQNQFSYQEDYRHSIEDEESKEWIPKNGELVECSMEDEDDWVKGFFIGHNDGLYVIYQDALDEVTKSAYYQYDHYPYCRKLENVTKTQSELIDIAVEALGISKDQLKIIND